MARFRDLSIRKKLMTGFMLTSLVALLVTMGALSLYDRMTVREEILADARMLAGVIGENAAGSIVFNDPQSATTTLSALRAQESVLAAYLYDREGKLFASYGTLAPPPRVPTDGPLYEAQMISVTRPVHFNGTRVGTVHVRSGLSALRERQRQYLYLTLAVLAMATLIALLLSALFQRAISRPILDLAELEKRVSREKNYELRAHKRSNDEVGLLIDGFNEMLTEIQARDAEIQERHRQEMALARTIQTSVLPHNFELPGFDVSAVMLPAEEVGGDFYEFRAMPDGSAWFGVGDVTGHGVTSGLIMMMAQSMFTMLHEQSAGQVTPSKFLALLNRAMFYNLHSRLAQDKFMTMVVGRIDRDGRMVFAGAHTDVLVFRAASRKIERVATEGLWLGMTEDIGPATVDRTLTLARGDVALFHTDGVTEARNRDGACFELERLEEQLMKLHREPASQIVTRIADVAWQWAGVPMDDVSLLALKRS
jgi:serine phosphatase RsbU (regulator of sigma subunit)